MGNCVQTVSRLPLNCGALGFVIILESDGFLVFLDILAGIPFMLAWLVYWMNRLKSKLVLKCNSEEGRKNTEQIH